MTTDHKDDDTYGAWTRLQTLAQVYSYALSQQKLYLLSGEFNEARSKDIDERWGHVNNGRFLLLKSIEANGKSGHDWYATMQIFLDASDMYWRYENKLKSLRMSDDAETVNFYTSLHLIARNEMNRTRALLIYALEDDEQETLKKEQETPEAEPENIKSCFCKNINKFLHDNEKITHIEAKISTINPCTQHKYGYVSYGININTKLAEYRMTCVEAESTRNNNTTV